ncbi:hypothetical protein BT96DRAFT_924421 [Gymnopus androsaceus JB14]|uniref:Uncharacterized protein n=1 Tax=Gymnopus androsaceus JB14 TaxID=1447944 RepID=A0A6A4H552_9AGAR|nr:hypothetical protein BT96DRAFT_924421 [Gymnopus androsaceus JB14]
MDIWHYCLTQRKRNQQKVMEQDSALHAWLTSVLPTYLIQPAMLYTTYYWVQIATTSTIVCDL